MKLAGTVRDFTSAHPDFGVTDPVAYGHVSPGIARSLDLGGRPVYTGGGRLVTSQFHDKDGHVIAPYGELGLVGGHFDVDVYNSAPSTKEIYHEHEFDDKFDVTYVDLVNDPKMLFESVVGSDYPNDLRLVFVNEHNGGGGTFVFEADAGEVQGYTSRGFETTFRASDLKQLRINFISLDDMRRTDPGTSQSDAADRDDSLSVQMYDVVTGKLVYELAVYNHYKAPKQGKKGKKGSSSSPTSPPPITPASGVDACGVPFDDTVGSFGGAMNGAVANSASFAQWFRTVPGTSLSARHDIELTLDGYGVYEYLTSEFFPVDGELYGNAGGLHNDLFTFSFSADFVYESCADQFFVFQGNDDAWVFINGEMVIDLGGVSTPSEQYVALDRLGLTNGETYALEFFYAKRRTTENSVFNMKTNLLLRSRLATLPPTSGLYD